MITLEAFHEAALTMLRTNSRRARYEHSAPLNFPISKTSVYLHRLLQGKVRSFNVNSAVASHSDHFHQLNARPPVRNRDDYSVWSAPVVYKNWSALGFEEDRLCRA